MAFLLPYGHDGRPYRSDDLHRGASYRTSRAAAAEGLSTTADSHTSEVAADKAAFAAIPKKHIVFPDPVAFRFLEDDPCVTVVERRQVLHGYELYLVEQWACSRRSPTLVIVTYTGDEKHSVIVGVLAVPVDESLWSTKLRVYLKATQQFHARRKETELGELMVTNLSSFPSALTVILIPEGDIRKHRQVFIVNEDLKRLGCSGRTGLTVTEPNKATQDKFRQLYRVSEKVPFFQAVTELVKMCQVALYMFEKLEHEYIDGLLCDVTETAIGNWWTQVGAEHYNFEPTDGILGPSTVAALLGMLMGARNRLNWYGAPVSKDVFDMESTKRGIAYFQKSQKLEKTRRLDRQTIFRLHTATAKAAAGEGWGIEKAVKSTMTDIAGKRGEIVMGMVSGKDKAGLAEVETLDYERFIALVSGERSKWLWHGKPRRTPTESSDYSQDMPNIFGRDDQGTAASRRIQSMPMEDELDAKKKDDVFGPYAILPPGSATSITESPGEKDALRRNVLKSVAGKMSDARSGFGRIKDAVGGGLRGHGSRLSISTREDMFDSQGASGNNYGSSSQSPAGVGRAFTWKQKPEEYLAAIKRGDPDSILAGREEPREVLTAPVDTKMDSSVNEQVKKMIEIDGLLDEIGAEVRKDVLPQAPAAVQSVAEERDLRGPLLNAERKDDPKQLALTRRHSLSMLHTNQMPRVCDIRWPRRMSFSDAEEAILIWEEIVEISDIPEDLDGSRALAEVTRQLHQNIDGIVRELAPWVEEKISMVERLDKRYSQDSEALQNLYHRLNEACRRVRSNSEELLAEERAHLTETVKEIEVLIARLEYEINALGQKVQDVEDGVRNFERQVDDVEKRAEELRVQLESESWLHWIVRTLTGIGTGPNITRAA
ncbi:Protein STB2 [Paramyrothecium foliicola]|nr:Protein STB2 [Paramyrothecium foliicola]